MYQKESHGTITGTPDHRSQYGTSTVSFNGPMYQSGTSMMQQPSMSGNTTYGSTSVLPSGVNATSSYQTGGSAMYQSSTSAHTPHQSESAVMVSHASSSGGQNVRKVSEVITSEKFIMPTAAYEQSSRKISSVVVFEEAEKMPERNIRYVEIPQYEEVVKHVARKEIREVEKFVPKMVEEWIERIVEIPQIEEVVRHVEVPQIQEIIKHVPKIEIVDRPFEVIKEVSKLQINKVEKVVEIGGEVIEVPKAIPVEEKVAIAVYDDKESMLIVSQKVKPVIIDGAAQEVVVDVIEYEPEVLPVDIHVAKFVDQELVLVGAKETIHRCVVVSAAQYNSMMRYLNVHLNAEEVANLPYLADHHGQVSFLPEEFQWFAPQEGLKIYGYRAGQIWGQGTVISTTSASTMTEAEIRVKQSELDRQFQQIFQQFESEKTRRVNAIEEFNRRSEQNARMQLGNQQTSTQQSSVSYGMTMGSSMPTQSIGYETYGGNSTYGGSQYY